MKLFVLALMLTVSIAHAESTLDELRAEIAQRKAAIAVMRSEGRATGRVEMTLFRLERELERRTFTEAMLKD